MNTVSYIPSLQENFTSKLLTFVAERILLIFQRHSDDYSLYTLQQRSSHFLGATLPWEHSDGRLHAQISPLLETQERHSTKIPPVFARLESAHSYVTHDSWYHRPRW